MGTLEKASAATKQYAPEYFAGTGLAGLRMQKLVTYRLMISADICKWNL